MQASTLPKFTNFKALSALKYYRKIYQNFFTIQDFIYYKYYLYNLSYKITQ